jgi:CRISPR-associated protein Cmr1
MEIKIKTLTPLWTGGVETDRMDRIHETGIIGSLRWWYEAIVRGMGGKACDSGRSACTFDTEEFKKARNDSRPEHECLHRAGLCDVCQVFGAAGWQRRFLLRVDGHAQPAWSPSLEGLNVRPPDRTRGWFLPPGYVGDVTLTVLGDETALKRLAALFLFLEKWGTIGAKSQLGYGCFQLKNRDAVLDNAAGCVWPKSDPKSDFKNLGKLPDLRDFTFFSFRFEETGKGWWTNVPGLERLLGRSDTSRVLARLVSQNMIPVAPALKNAWRYQEEQIAEGRQIFGTIHPERIRSKIAVSWAYKTDVSWQVRGWSWLPDRLPSEVRQEILRRIGDQAVWVKTLKATSGELTLSRGKDLLQGIVGE